MKKNMGPIDRILRSIVAIALIVLYLTDILTGTLGIILFVLAIVMLISSLIGICPPYALMGFNTCKKKKD